MPQSMQPGPPWSIQEDAATAIRTTVEELGALDSSTAGFMNALAFVLARVADVDQQVSQHERELMELLLVDHAGLTRAQAVLVVEIARHRTRLADCGCSYVISRGLRSKLDPERRRKVLDCLFAVADADGRTTPLEASEIRQIAHELGLADDDIAG